MLKRVLAVILIAVAIYAGAAAIPQPHMGGTCDDLMPNPCKG